MTTTLALTGESVPGVPGATWKELPAVGLNHAGSVAFGGTLQHSEAISDNNDLGLWLFDGMGQHLLAQTGSGNVPGIPGTDFVDLDRPQLSETNEVFVSGRLLVDAGGITNSNDDGMWKFSSSTQSLIMQSGSGGVPSLPSASFDGAPSPLGLTNVTLADNGEFTLMTDLRTAVGGVSNTSNRGLWHYASGGSNLIVREGTSEVPSISGANFNTFGTPDFNTSGQQAILGGLKISGSVNASNNFGIWRYSQDSPEMLMRSGVGGVPGFPSDSFLAVGDFRINESGTIVFAARLDDLPQSQGIWSYEGTTGQMVASVTTVVPGATGAKFEEFTLASYNDANEILAFGTLELETGGVTADDRHGLWILNENEQLIARSGSGNVPGIANASFASFGNATMNDLGLVAFAADLQIGEDIDTTNDSGLWVIDPQGESRLIAREGETLAGRTIASLEFRSEGRRRQTTGFNNAGEVAFQATFTNGDQGLFLFRPSTADFDGDLDVDADDLVAWQTAYGTTSLADANGDNDSDGADFLAWQREFGSGSLTQPILTQVPEPAGISLLLLAWLARFGFRPRDQHKR